MRKSYYFINTAKKKIVFFKRSNAYIVSTNSSSIVIGNDLQIKPQNKKNIKKVKSYLIMSFLYIKLTVNILRE
jgi:hypothetical protein